MYGNMERKNCYSSCAEAVLLSAQHWTVSNFLQRSLGFLELIQ